MASTIETIAPLIVGIITTGFATIQIYKAYTDRKLKESIAKARESSTGQEALHKLASAQETFKKDMESIEEEIDTLKDEMFTEKKELQIRLEKLREHFDDMTKDVLKILSSK